MNKRNNDKHWLTADLDTTETKDKRHEWPLPITIHASAQKPCILNCCSWATACPPMMRSKKQGTLAAKRGTLSGSKTNISSCNASAMYRLKISNTRCSHLQMASRCTNYCIVTQSTGNPWFPHSPLPIICGEKGSQRLLTSHTCSPPEHAFAKSMFIRSLEPQKCSADHSLHLPTSATSKTFCGIPTCRNQLQDDAPSVSGDSRA